MSAVEGPREDWYRSVFDRFYPLIYAHRNEDAASEEVAGIIGLLGGLPEEAKVLDLCCGAGRHMKALRGKKIDIFGLDLSAYLLREASRHPLLSGRLVRGDIRRLPFSGGFFAILNLFTSFGYFVNDEENELALEEMARLLVPGGLLIMDHMNRDRVERDLVEQDSREENGLHIRQSRRIEGDRIIKEIYLDSPDGARLHLTENVRLFDPRELESLLARHHFQRPRFFGSFAGEPFTPLSDRMIAAARKAGG